MKKSKHEIIIDGLKGLPITDLIGDWTFTIKEVAPYVFKAKGRNIKGHTSYGAGGTAEEALDNCLKRTDKIIMYEKRKAEIKDKLKKIFRIRV